MHRPDAHRRYDAYGPTSARNQARAAAAGHRALDQLRGYLADECLRRDPSVRYIGMALVFHGWELAWCEAASPP